MNVSACNSVLKVMIIYKKKKKESCLTLKSTAAKNTQTNRGGIYRSIGRPLIKTKKKNLSNQSHDTQELNYLWHPMTILLGWNSNEKVKKKKEHSIFVRATLLLFFFLSVIFKLNCPYLATTITALPNKMASIRSSTSNHFQYHRSIMTLHLISK